MRQMLDNQNKGPKMGQTSVSKCERELKKLECTINYGGQRSGKNAIRDEESFAKVRMKIKILSWNVRGVNNPEKKKVIKQFTRDQQVDLVCLQETKVQKLTLRMT